MATSSRSFTPLDPDGFAALFGRPSGQTVVAGQRILLGYGKANFANVSSSYSVMRVAAPFDRASAVNTGKRISKQPWAMLSPWEGNGGIGRETVEHPNGTVIELRASWRRTGVPIKDGALFVRLRVGAPLYQIDAKLPIDNDNHFGEFFNIFQGYGDVMTAPELAQIGIIVSRSYSERFMSMEEIGECFNFRQLAAETVARPTLTEISTPQGIEMREALQPPMRRMNIRKR